MANPSADYPAAVHTEVDISSFSSNKLGSTSPTHTQVEGKQEAEIGAIQTKLGIGASNASDATTGQVLTKQSDGSTSWANVISSGGATDIDGGNFTDSYTSSNDDIDGGSF